MDDRRFFASAPVPELADLGFGAGFGAVVGAVGVGRVVVLDENDLLAAFGLDELVEAAGFRAAEVLVVAPLALFSARVSVLADV